jgi:hypothetical protein
MCDRQPAADSLAPLLAPSLFTPDGVEDGPSAIDTAVMQAASPDDVPNVLASFYDGGAFANS